MRLKSQPRDFVVIELLDWDEVKTGEYVVHHVRKEKLSTPEALARIASEKNIDRADIAYAGMKDRQAITEQFITVKGQEVRMNHPHLRVRPVGRTDRALTSKQSKGNRFEIHVRGLRVEQAAAVRRAMPSIMRAGLPNYFDDQRFGCLKHGQGFVMQRVLEGDFEQALQQLVASPSEAALGGDVKLKQLFRKHWGDWQTCRDLVRGPMYTRVFDHLARKPGDFHGALSLMPTRVKLIHAFAFQSWLWNRAVNKLLFDYVEPPHRLTLDSRSGRLVAWRNLERDAEAELTAMRTPLYAAEGNGGDRPFSMAMADTMKEAGLTREDFLAHVVPGMLFKEEDRALMIKPRDVEDVRIGRDDENPGFMQVRLAFSLPRGCYATLLVKRLFAKRLGMFERHEDFMADDGLRDARGSGHGNSSQRGYGRDSGHRDSGQRGYGDRDSGHRDSGHRDSGQRGYGDRDSGHRDSGQRGFGNRDSGQRESARGSFSPRGYGNQDAGDRGPSRDGGGRGYEPGDRDRQGQGRGGYGGGGGGGGYGGNSGGGYGRNSGGGGGGYNRDAGHSQQRDWGGDRRPDQDRRDDRPSRFSGPSRDDRPRSDAPRGRFDGPRDSGSRDSGYRDRSNDRSDGGWRGDSPPAHRENRGRSYEPNSHRAPNLRGQRGKPVPASRDERPADRERVQDDANASRPKEPRVMKRLPGAPEPEVASHFRRPPAAPPASEPKGESGEAGE